ncbi:MAG: hypothetical protein ABSA80_18725, partial [Terriglobales bacterium]
MPRLRLLKNSGSSRFRVGHDFTACGKTLIGVETGFVPSQTAEELWLEQVSGRARLHSLRKKS